VIGAYPTILLLALASPVPSGAWLFPADQRPVDRPYASATLRLRRMDAGTVTALELVPKGGGPTLRYPVTLAPKQSVDIPVALPAISVQQSYTVRLHMDGKLEEWDASVTWPAETVDRVAGRLIDPMAYEPWEFALPVWRPALRRNVLLACVLGCLACAACLLIRPRWLRVGCVLVAIGATTAGVAALAGTEPTQAVTQAEEGDLLVVTARRSGVWRSADTSHRPIYQAMWQFREDETIIEPGRSIRMPIRPRQVRLLRRAQPSGGSSPSSFSSRDGSSSPAN